MQPNPAPREQRPSHYPLLLNPIHRRAALAASCLCLAAAAGRAQTIKVVGATEKVYEYDTALPSPSASATLYAAQNEFEGFQVVIQGPSSGISVTAGTLTGPGGFQIVPSSAGFQGNIMVYRELFFSLPPSGKPATDPAAKEGNAPDALIPQYDEFYQEPRNTTVSSIGSGQNAVYFVDIHVPENATPGVYSGSVTVNHDGIGTPVSVSLTVWPFKLDSTSHLKTAYGFGWNAATSQYPALSGQGSTPTLAQAHVRHAIMGLNHRITISVMDYGYNYAASGLAEYKNQFGALINGQAGTLLAGARPTTLAYMGADDRSQLASWRDYFNQNGWGDRLYDYTDEPGIISTWCDLYNRTNAAYTAGVRSMVTTSIAQVRDSRNTCNGTAIDPNKINTFIPNVTQVQPEAKGPGETTLGEYSTWKTPSNEIWEYQSCNSWGCGGGSPTGYPSTATDHSAIRARAMEWVTFRNGLTGELYWNAAYSWIPQSPPLNPWTDQNYSHGNGDGTLLFPGVATSSRVGGTHDIPLASLRLKMIREGMEDYEYMYILGTLGDTSYANSQVDSIFPTAHSVTGVNPAALYTARQNLACKIIQDQHPTWSCTDPSTWGTGSNPTLTVSNTGSGTGTVTSTPPGINCGTGGTACQASFAPGTAVTLNATPDAGSTFSGYAGDCTGSSCALTMNASKLVTASFSKPCNSSDCFNRADSPNLGSNWNTYLPALQIVSGQATNTDLNTKAAQWLPSIGADQDVAVDCKVAGPGNNCGVMARWTDAGNHYYAYLDAGLGTIDLWRVQAGSNTKIGSATRTISANAYHHLRLVAQGSALSVYFENEGAPAISVTDTALPAGNYGGLHAFAGAAQSVWYAAFDIKPIGAAPSYAATVTKSGTGTGTVTSSPAGIDCGATCSASFPSGTPVTLTATPASGSSFAGFTGGCTSSSTTCTFTITSNTTIDAAFTTNDFSMSVNPSSNSAAQGSSASYTASTAVTSGAAQTVSFSTSGLPAGATASFNPASVTAGASSALTVSVGSSTSPGTYSFNVVGTGTSTTRTVPATLTVTAAGTIVFRAMSTYVEQSTSSNSMNLVVPTSVQPNDVMIATIFAGDYTSPSLPVVSAPPGWTLVKQISHGTAALLQVYSRVALAGDAGTTHSWRTDVWVGAACSLVAYSGVNTQAPIDAIAVQDNTAASASFSTPAVTTTAGGEVLLATYAGYSGAGSLSSWSTPSGMTQRVLANRTNLLLSLSNDDITQAAAGGSGTYSATASRVQDYAFTALVALRPSTVPAPISFRAVSTYSEQSTSSNSMDLVVPTSVQPGDVMVASIFAGDYTSPSLPVVSAPPGWVLVKQVSHGTSALLQIYSRVADGLDAGKMYSWGTNVWVGAAASLSAYSGASGVDASAVADNPSAGTTYSTPSVTTTAGGDLLFAVYAGFNVNGPTASWSTPAGMTQRVFVTHTSLRMALANDDKIQSAAGASGTFSSTANVSQSYALTALVALKR